MNITNPIYFELLKYKLISKNLKVLSKTTRDKKIKDIQDTIKFPYVIFLEKFLKNHNYYRDINPKDIIIKKKKIFSLTPTSKEKIVTEQLDDDRRRYNFLKKLLSNKKILDFGCAWGGFLSLIKNSKYIYGIEKREICIQHIKKFNKNIIISNNLGSYNKLKFDIITMFHVLEHIPEQTKILKNLRSRLSKNGKLIIEVPSAHDFLLNFKELPEFKSFTFWSEHLILHTERTLLKFLKGAGFNNVKIVHFQRYSFLNHLGWFINKKPGGHNFFNKLYDRKIDNEYKNYLIRNKYSDTLIAIAS